MPLDVKQSSPAISDSALRMPSGFPALPADVISRFPSMSGWMEQMARFWDKNVNAVQEFAHAVLDVTEIAGVLVVDPNSAALYIRRSRGEGKWADPDTGFFVNRDSYFSLSNLLMFDPQERTLTVEGTIIAIAGEIGGFEIGADYIRDTADSFGLSSAVSGGDDVRFWAGDSFANRATAPFRVTEAGVLTATSGTVGGWTLSTTTLSGTNAVLSSAGTLLLGTGNDVAIMSANDATYRLWIGNATAGTAAFSVTKAGALTSISGTIGGWTISATELSTNGVWGSVVLPGGGSFISLTGPAGTGATLVSGSAGVEIEQVAAATICFTTEQSGDSNVRFSMSASGIMLWGSGSAAGDTNLYRSGANALQTDDAFTAASFTGTGAGITSLNASNINAGTLSSSHMPSSFGGTFTGTVDTTYLEAGVTTAVDVKDGNFRVYDGGTQNARIDYTTGFYYVQGNQVVGARGTKGAGTITEVVALLDAWGAWA